MTKDIFVSIRLVGDICHVENNVDMIIQSVDFMGLDSCCIQVSDANEVNENA